MQFLTASVISTLAVSFLVCSSSSLQAQSTDFTFDSLAPYTFSPLTMSQNGITATFTDPSGPPHPGGGQYDDGQFLVVSKDNPGNYGNYYSSAFSGNVLLSEFNHSIAYDPLVILFNQPVYSVSFDFALPDWPVASAPVTFSAYYDGASVGTQSFTAAPLAPHWFPEGIVHYSSTQAFNQIVVNADASPYLIVDNVSVSAAPVPEASTIVSLGLLLALGLGSTAVRLRRRQARSAA